MAQTAVEAEAQRLRWLRQSWRPKLRLSPESAELIAAKAAEVNKQAGLPTIQGWFFKYHPTTKEYPSAMELFGTAWDGYGPEEKLGVFLDGWIVGFRKELRVKNSVKDAIGIPFFGLWYLLLGLMFIHAPPVHEDGTGKEVDMAARFFLAFVSLIPLFMHSQGLPCPRKDQAAYEVQQSLGESLARPVLLRWVVGSLRIAMSRLYPMNIGEVDRGGRIDVHAQVLCFDPAHDFHLCAALPSGTKFGFKGLLSGEYQKFSLLNGVMCKQFPTPLLVSDDQSKVFGVSHPTWESLHAVIDACSGFGGLTQGSIAMGFHPVVAIDQNERMISLYQSHLNVDTLVGDIGENEYVASEVSRFVNATGFHCSRVNLALQKIWPSRRNRAWWLFTSPMIGEISLGDWDSCKDVTVVGHVIPRISLWDASDEVMLQLNAEEMNAFGANDGSITRFLLNLAGVSPCALHAWGNQMHPCPCGCRARALSAHRLQTRGLYGLLLKYMSEHGTAVFRHAHPNEVIGLQCMDPVLDFGPQVKLTLSAAGQLASPAQSVWLFAHISQRLEEMEHGKSGFCPNAHLQAYRSWVLMRCRQVWQPETEPIQDPNMVSLMGFWSQFRDLSLNELVYGPRWPNIPDGPLHLAAILDYVIRSANNVLPRSPRPGENEISSDDEDHLMLTPWLDKPKIDVSHWLPGLSSDMGHILFAEFGEPPVSFEVHPNTVIQQVLDAQARLTGPFEVIELLSPNGQPRAATEVILPGDVVCIRAKPVESQVSISDGCDWECGRLPKMPEGPFEATTGECGLLPRMPEGPFAAITGECGLLPRMPEGPFEAVPWECGLLPKLPGGPFETHRSESAMAIAPTAMDVECDPLPASVIPQITHGRFESAITPTAEWTQIPQTASCAVSKFDVGECVVGSCTDANFDTCVSALPLLGLQGDQFMKLSLHTVENEKHLWALRHQFFSVADRLAVLEHQQTVWADDEMRYHLHSLVKNYVEHQARTSRTPVRQCIVVDPLVSSSWVLNTRAMQQWAAAHPEIFGNQQQVITVLLVSSHWIPLVLRPNGQVLDCLLWDAPSADHTAVNRMLDGLALSLGFARVLVNCHKRMFFTSSLCGALAVAFIQHHLLGTLLPTNNEDAQNFHAKYRDLFCQSLATVDIATRPWQWGSGDRDSLDASVPQVASVSTGFGREAGGSHVCIDLTARLDLFQEHGLEWADDEIRYHITNMLCSRDNVVHSAGSAIAGFAFLEPLILEAWRDVGPALCTAWCRENQAVRTHQHHIVSAVLHDYHWTPIWIVPHETTLVMHLYGHDHSCEPKVMQLLHCLVQELGFQDWAIHWSRPTLPEHDLCGAMAICFLGSIIVRAQLPSTIRALRDLHTEMRASYVAALYNGYTCRCPIAWGRGPVHQVVKDLAAELVKHGVPKEHADSRSQQALKAIGSEQIITALQHRQPWRQLKILGNNARFQFLLPSEFNALIDANQGKSVGKKPKSVRPSAPNAPVDPAKLVLLDGTFRAKNQPVSQILPHQIGPVAAGIALISAQAAAPYLRAGAQVSQEPLAILIMHTEDMPISTVLPHTQVTVPCKCILNQEPLLIEATLVQLGGTPVEKHVHSVAVALDSLEVAAVKVLVYADEFVGTWSEFCSAPIKHLVTIFPVLKRCFESNCKCDCWHNPDQLPVKEPILDVWRRQHLKNNFKQAAMDKSELFSVCIRVPLELVPLLLSGSGRSGAYTEPRTPDAKALLEDYAVIWVAELLHMKQTHPAVVGLARLGDRKGLRVLTSQAQSMHQILKPDTVFLPQGPRLHFAAGPFPWGTDRHAIQRAMKSIQWDTKPLQPLQPVPGRGTMWMLQSVDEPPETIVHMSHGEVLITKHRDASTLPKQNAAHSVGSASTLSLCAAPDGAKNSDDDPLAMQDPWSTFRPTTKPAVPIVTSHSETMQQLESRIQNAVLAKVQAGSPMEQDDMPERLQALEGQALNPGPPDSSCGEFSLGTFNPSGLRNKAQFIHSEVPAGDLWAISETHFFGRDLQRFRAGLRFVKSDYRYCLVDQPSLKPTVLQKHSWKGVAVVSLHPSRHVPSGLPFEIQNSSRAMITTTLIGDSWVTGATIYGEPDGHLYPNRLDHNASLLHHAACQVCHLQSGLRFLAGDFNMLLNEVPAFEILHGAGFKDIQDVAAERWGLVPRPTCKNKTRKDFLFLSPELQRLLKETWVLDDIWPDHSLLMASFHAPRTLPPRMVWPSPRELPWPKDFAFQFSWHVDDPDPTAQYAALWNSIETAATEASVVPIHRTMKGRAQHFQPVAATLHKHVPGKAGRPGDFQAEFHGASFRHGQWIRQVRRLQCYVRCVRNPENIQSTHALQLWGAILRASGFAPSFASWWERLDVRFDNCPATCPIVPPDLQCAEAMFDTLSQAVRSFESQLKSASRQYARVRREADPNLVFQDIRAQPNQGVELLAQSRQAHIQEVRVDEQSIVVHPSCEWNPSHPVYCGGRALHVVHVEPDCLWVDDVADLEAGMLVAQTRWVGCDDEISAEFLSAWRAKWMKHADVPPARWHTIIEFARQHLPRQTFHWDPMMAHDLATVIASKHKRSAAGLDGVALCNLKSMPSTVLAEFCQIFRTAELFGRWPKQLIDGRVTSLAKHEAPSTAMDFRPITVFGLLYRCWGSFHSRQAIKVMDAHLPASLFGSRSDCHATQVWSKIMYAVEFAFQQRIQLCGLVADIQKAFNCLPRLVVFEACGLLGVPPFVLLAWAAAVSSMERRFTLRENVSQPLPSCTGFAEGDGLSCLAMIAIDTLFHVWFQVFFPLGQPLTYVDDWQVLCTDPNRMSRMMECLEQFVSAVDLSLDRHKTYTWALDCQSRSHFRGAGFTVVLGARNLGAQVQMSRKHLNSVQMQRIESLQPLWPRLRMSLSAYGSKLRAIRAAAWPRGLHAVAATSLSDQTFQTLRSGAMRGLSADGAGCSPIIHLGLVEDPNTDPLFWTCVQSFRSARDCGDENAVMSALCALVAGDVSIPNNGINAVLLSRLQVFGWHVHASGLVSDELGSFHLFHISIAELVWRASWAWLYWVADAVAHRPGFRYLERTDPGATRKWLHTLGVSDRALARKLLNGAHITQDCKVHCQEDGTSRWNGGRVLPKCRGPVRDLALLHLFTDGSCLFQSDPDVRLAAWSVVMASPDSQCTSARVVQAGCLPGVLQTAHRAEAFAILQALQVATGCLVVMLWSDCEAVVKRVRRILRDLPPKVNSSNADIWMPIFDLVQSRPRGSVVITHVHSHRSVLSAQNDLEEWCFFHNALADRAAVKANHDRSVEFWHFFHAHVEAVGHVRYVSSQVQQTLLAISQAVVQEEDMCEPDVEIQGLCVPSEVPAGAWTGLRGYFYVPEAAVRWYGQTLVRKLLSWFWFTVQPDEPVRWVSQFQLYIDFMLSSGEIGPVHFSKWGRRG
eukprot:s2285_g3.t1